jgi:hypothetical protein
MLVRIEAIADILAYSASDTVRITRAAEKTGNIQFYVVRAVP